MKQRVITGIIFGAIVLALLLFHDIGRSILLVLIPMLAVLEYSKITKFSIIEYAILGCGILALAMSFYSGFDNWHFILWGNIALNLFLLINLFFQKGQYTHKNLKSIIALIYIIAPFYLAFETNLQSTFKFILLSTMILIWIADSSAYFVGSQIGKKKLFPSISPGKTWEGLLGSIMCTLIASYILFSIFDQGDWGLWVIFGLVTSILGVFGDLIASHVKRIYGVKDSSNILPGHGGFYDRFDAFIYVLPFVIFIFQYNSKL